MNEPLVSIIIPCFNAERWLSAAIQSALAQTWPATEIIVVNDGSTDGSRAVAESMGPRGVRVLSQPNRGAAAARNAGLASARGKFFQFLDADDLLAPEKIAVQMQMAATSCSDVLFSGRWGRFRQDIADTDFPPQPLCADFSPVEWVVTKFHHHAMMHPAAWLVPSALVARGGAWNEHLSLDDDGEFFTRMVLQSQAVRYCPGALSFYRSQLPASLSGTKSETAAASALRSLEASIDLLLQHENSPRTRLASAMALQHYIYETYPLARASRRRTLLRVRELGGCDLLPPGGPRFHLLRRLFGWRLAKRLQRIARR